MYTEQEYKVTASAPPVVAVPVPSPPMPASNNPTRLNNNQTSQILAQGFTRGLVTVLEQTLTSFPLRIWVIDNSGSMNQTDGHRIVETSRSNDVKLVSCTRWNEIVETVDYHAQLAALLKAPTIFRILNEPDSGISALSQLSVAYNSSNEYDISMDLSRLKQVMASINPTGTTPLTRHVLEIRTQIVSLEPTLRARGQRVAVILATDGLPTDDYGQSGFNQTQEFVNALRTLERLPVWVVIRLCTDQDEVVKVRTSMAIIIIIIC